MKKKIIDLRSDTVTKPCDEMRKVIARAIVGDDVYGEDPTVNELEEKTARMLGKEKAIFVPTGTMSNQIALCTQCESGSEIIAEATSHVFLYETAAAAMLARVQIRQLQSQYGAPEPDAVKNAVRPREYHHPRTALIWLENTHNAHGGVVLPQSYINEIKEIADKNDVKLHLDGARIWNSSIASGRTPAEIAAPFDSVSVCFSKGLGAPAGSALCGSEELITKARRFRKALGGGMRQSGLLAAGAIFALDNRLNALADDHAKARGFAETIAWSGKAEIDFNRVQTNMVVFEQKTKLSNAEFLGRCAEKGLLMGAIGSGFIRAAFHRDATREDAGAAAEIVLEALEEK